MVTSQELSLIKELRKNSRQPLTEVGKALSIPPGSLHSIVKRLRNQGVVRKYLLLSFLMLKLFSLTLLSV